MAAGEEILKRMDALEKKLDRLLAHLGADRPANAANGSGQVAPVSQIQGEHGDPEIGKPPRDWKGQSYEGYVASECPPDFLDVYADFLDWKADNPRPGKEKYAKYDRLNAQRCRRWAVEIREGRHKPRQRRAAPPPPDNGAVLSSGGMPPPPADDFGPPLPDDDYGAPPGYDSDIPF